MDIKIFRSRSYHMRYRHKDTAGNPVSLVGATVYFTVKTAQWDNDADDSDAKIKKTITSHSNAEGGITEWDISDLDSTIDPAKYNYDVIVEYGGKALPPSLYGKFEVEGTPTNRNVGNE